MSQLRRRLRKLEAALTDGSGLVPRSPAWLEYWMNEYGNLMEDRNYPCGPIPLEAISDEALNRWIASHAIECTLTQATDNGT